MNSLPRQLQQLDALLARIAAVDGSMLLGEFDGFTAGILVCPEPIMPEEWLPIVLGDDDGNAGVFESEADLQACLKLMLRHHDTVSRDLQRGRGRYAPIFDVDLRNDETLWELWMSGFGRAVALYPESWEAIVRDGDDEAAVIAMAGMMTLIEIANRDGEVDPDPELTTELTQAAPDLIPGWIDTLSAWRARNTTGQAVPTQAAKVGRNDPCPCGSGRKYKKCCGFH